MSFVPAGMDLGVKLLSRQNAPFIYTPFNGRQMVHGSTRQTRHLAIGVPIADGSVEEIEYLPCNSALKTLGLLTCPMGSNTAALDRMHLQGQEWVDRVLTSTLSHRNMWFMVDCQFWPMLGYGICNNLAT
jgi:hypothetical protein